MFGGVFTSRSYGQFFKSRKSMEYNSYSKAHFNITSYSNSFTTENPSVLGHFASLLTNAVQNKGDSKKLLPLPKLIVVIPEDDLLSTIERGFKEFDSERDLSKAYSRIVNFIMTEYERGVATFKENLPAKCFRNVGYPYFLWIELPYHKNFKANDKRFKFNRSIEEIAHLHSNVFTLELKKVRNPDDENLYSERFTNEGYLAYWEAVDKTIRYFDSVILKKNEKKIAKSSDRKNMDGQKDRFRWQNPYLNKDPSGDFGYKKLPPPPPPAAYRH